MHTASLITKGFLVSPESTVGALYVTWASKESEGCTGTVVPRDLGVLTTAHCLWNLGKGGWARSVQFFPGMTYDPTNPGFAKVPPGAAEWYAALCGPSTARVVCASVPKGYLLGDHGLDYGLVRINGRPKDGSHLGAVTGSSGITWNFFDSTSAAGKLVRIVGYPAEGFWSTAAGHFGYGQYQCVSTLDSTPFASFSTFLSSSPFLETACSMNGGASGSPWFVFYNGSWTVGGIQEACLPPDHEKYCRPQATSVISPWFEGRFHTFLTSVLGGAAATRAAASASEHPKD